MTSRYDDDEQPRKKPAPAEEYDAEEADWEAGYDPAEEYDYEPPAEDDEEDDDEQVHVQPAAPVKPAATSKPAPRPARPAAPQRSRVQGAKPAQPATRPAASRSAAPRPAQGSTRISRPVGAAQQKPKQSTNYMIPLAVSGVLVLALIAVLFFVNNNGASGGKISNGTPVVVEGTVVPRGATVATVNDVPIYERDFQERADKDKANMMADPLSAALLNNFQGITGTRALEVVRYDALDKLINLEVIRQQAKAEGLYPDDAQQQQMIDLAKQSDLKDGMTFVDFLNAHNIGQEQYNNSVLTNVVYTVMAQKHAPATGTPDDKSNGFLAWVCSTRKNYTVNIIMHFTDVNNQPCTSGPPVDIDVFGSGEEQIPDVVPTGDVPTVAAPIKAP